MRVLQIENSRKSKVIFHAYDRKILALLCKNVRLPLSKIAQLLRLSRQSIEYRLKVMEQAHLLAGSRAVINIRKMGYQSYHTFFTLADEGAKQILHERALSSEQVNSLITYSGKYTHELSIMARTPNEAQQYFIELIEKIPVSNIVPCIILQTVKASVLPELQNEKLPAIKNLRNDPSFSKQFSLSERSCLLDEKDYELLYLLSQNAQMSLTEIGNKTHLSSDTVSYRLKKLIRGKYILEFRPVINYEALSYSVEAILIKAQRTKTEDEHFQQYVKNHVKTLWATELFGQWDYLIYLIHHSQDEIHEYLNALHKQFPGHILSYELLFAYREYKYAFMTEAMKRQYLR